MNIRTFSISSTPDENTSSLLSKIDDEIKKLKLADDQIVDITIETSSTPNSKSYKVGNIYYEGKEDSTFSMSYEEFISESESSVDALHSNMTKLGGWLADNSEMNIYDLKSSFTVNDTGETTVSTRVFYSAE
jgi:hypothetical protein